MNRTQKILLGVASFLPIVLGITIMIRYLLLIKQLILSGMMTRNDANVTFLFMHRVFTTILPLIIAALVVYVILLIIFILHTARNRSISDTERVIWIIAFFVVNGIAFPVYFFMRVAAGPELPGLGTVRQSGM